MVNEKRLIDANELRAILADEESQWFNSTDYYPNWLINACIESCSTVDAVEVVHSRFVNVLDFGDDQGCFGYCERCRSIHHAQHPTALKADYRWCRWCGAKMDGVENE